MLFEDAGRLVTDYCAGSGKGSLTHALHSQFIFKIFIKRLSLQTYIFGIVSVINYSETVFTFISFYALWLDCLLPRSVGVKLLAFGTNALLLSLFGAPSGPFGSTVCESSQSTN